MHTAHTHTHTTLIVCTLHYIVLTTLWFHIFRDVRCPVVTQHSANSHSRTQSLIRSLARLLNQSKRYFHCQCHCHFCMIFVHLLKIQNKLSKTCVCSIESVSLDLAHFNRRAVFASRYACFYWFTFQFATNAEHMFHVPSSSLSWHRIAWHGMALQFCIHLWISNIKH